MRFVPAILFAATCLAAPALAQERPDLPPPELVVDALDNHPSVEAAGADVAAARAEARMLSKGPHEVTLVGSYIRRSVTGEGGFDEFDGTLQRGLRLPGKARLDREAGRLGIEEASNNHEDARHQASLVLMRGWHDLLYAAAIVRTDRAELTNYDALVRAVERRRELRDAAQLDVDQVSAERALVQARLAQDEAILAEARSRLRALFPSLPLPVEVPEPATPRPPLVKIDTLHDLVIARSHEIRAAEKRAERFGVLGERARKDRLADPTVGVRLFSERSGVERGAGVVFSIPFGGGYRSAAADKAGAEAKRAQLELVTVRREIAATADADASNARALLAGWRAADSAATSADAVSRLSREAYDAGVSDLAELLAVERQALAARRAEVEARVAALRAVMKLRIDLHDMWGPVGDTD